MLLDDNAHCLVAYLCTPLDSSNFEKENGASKFNV
jgi:hypothetical protein